MRGYVFITAEMLDIPVTALPPTISVEAEVLKEEIARSCLWFNPMHVDLGPVRWLPSARYGKGGRRTPVNYPFGYRDLSKPGISGPDFAPTCMRCPSRFGRSYGDSNGQGSKSSRYAPSDAWMLHFFRDASPFPQQKNGSLFRGGDQTCVCDSIRTCAFCSRRRPAPGTSGR